VRRTEGIVDEYVSQLGKRLAQLRIVLGLALHVTGVFQQHHVAVFQAGSLSLGILACYISSHDDFFAQKLAQPVSHDLQAQLGLPLALGLAHVGAQDHLRALIYQVLNGGHGSHDPLVGSDLAFLGGDVEVAAAQNPLAGYFDVFNRLLVVVHCDSSKYDRELLSHFTVIQKTGEA